MTNRRDFIKKTLLTGAAAFAAPSFLHSENEMPAIASLANESNMKKENDNNPLIIPKNNGLRITGTFLDEISHDIPHQNWGVKEWDRDFQYMKNIGIDTVILIRSGYRKFITYPSKYLLNKGCYMPSMDLVDLFLQLAEKYRSHLNLLRKYKMGDFCIFVLPQTISYKSPICTKYSAKIQ